MRFALVTATAALAIAGGAWAGTSSGGAGEALRLKETDWLTAPSADERNETYPKAAFEAGAAGETALRCKVKADGGLEACVVANETPTGMGFGEAALALAGRFRLKPDAVPRPAPGETQPEVTVPIRWSTLDQPDWASMPTGDQLAALFPDTAHAERASGHATMRCEVKADGTLTSCVIVSETPKGMGFGTATLRAASYFRAHPEMTDGRPIAGHTVTIPIAWRLPGSDLPPQTSAPRTTRAVDDGLQGQVGDGAKLILALKPGVTQADVGQVFDCPSAADKTRKCLARAAPWLGRPSNAQAWEVINRRRLLAPGVTSLGCRIGDDGALVDCKVVGTATPDQEAAMRELTAGLKAAPETWDAIPTHRRVVRVRFDWVLLRLATTPRPGAPG
jgi:TonB family protein